MVRRPSVPLVPPAPGRIPPGMHGGAFPCRCCTGYPPGWKGLHSIVAITIPQLRTWLKHGNMKRPAAANTLDDASRQGQGTPAPQADHTTRLREFLQGTRT